MLSKDDTSLAFKYAPELNAFRKVCETWGEASCFEETDFYDFSVGFFIALGITGDSINSPPVTLSDAFSLARISRYHYQYWRK